MKRILLFLIGCIGCGFESDDVVYVPPACHVSWFDRGGLTEVHITATCSDAAATLSWWVLDGDVAVTSTVTRISCLESEVADVSVRGAAIRVGGFIIDNGVAVDCLRL